MFYIWFQDFITGQWSGWRDSSYGPFPKEDYAKTFCAARNKDDPTRRYKYMPHTTHGKKPADNAGIPPAKVVDKSATELAPDDLKEKAKDALEAAADKVFIATSWSNDRGPQMASPKGMTIFKYQLPILEAFTLDFPKESKILRLETVEGKVWVWVLHDLRKPKVPYHFRAFKTGASIPDDVAKNLVGYVWHYTLNIQQELCLYVFQEAP